MIPVCNPLSHFMAISISAVFGFSSSPSVPAFVFSFLRSINRAAFFCFFSRRAVSFCRFLNVSLAIKPPFQSLVRRKLINIKPLCRLKHARGGPSSLISGFQHSPFFPSGCFLPFAHVESLIDLFLGHAFFLSRHF